MIIQIRNMHDHRCIETVKKELDDLGFCYKSVKLGSVTFQEDISDEKWRIIDIAMRDVGLELIKDRTSRMMEVIKTAIHKLVYLSDEESKTNISKFMDKEILGYYPNMSRMFSEESGVTIERYINVEKIERVKDLLIYENLSLTDISYKMQYSSVAHLSSQFKRVTGFTPTRYREIIMLRRGENKAL